MVGRFEPGAGSVGKGSEVGWMGEAGCRDHSLGGRTGEGGVPNSSRPALPFSEQILPSDVK